MLWSDAMLEYVVCGVAIVGFLLQYVYYLGKVEGKLDRFSVEIAAMKGELLWIRNFLISQNADAAKFSQNSVIDFSNNVELPRNTRDVLDKDVDDYAWCNTPYDCAVAFSRKYGLVKLKQDAEKANIKFESLLLASGVYLYNKFCKKGDK